MEFGFMEFSDQVTLGNIFIIVTLIGIAIRMGIKIGVLQMTVSQNAATLLEHAQRLDRYEARLMDVANELQRLVGRIEATQDRLERHLGSPRGS